MLINKVSYTEELGLSLIYIGLFTIISVHMIFTPKKLYYNFYKFIIWFLIFLFIKDQTIIFINNMTVQQILFNIYNIHLNIVGFYQEYLPNLITYQCQDKSSTIEIKSFIIEKNINNYYKNIINNYIINNYISFNNNNYYIKLLTKELYINFEIFLITLQKISYEYINSITPFYNFYSNYKLLINKTLVQNNFENLYYNSSLNLLLDTTYLKVNQKDFLHFLEKRSKKQNLELINFLTNYYNSFNNFTFYVYNNISNIFKSSFKSVVYEHQFGLFKPINLNTYYVENPYNLKASNPGAPYIYDIDNQKNYYSKDMRRGFAKKAIYGLSYDLNINRNNNIYNLNWIQDFNNVYYDILPTKLDFLKNNLIQIHISDILDNQKYKKYDTAWLHNFSTKKDMISVDWYAKNKKVWIYKSNWFKNLVNDIITLDVTIKRTLIKIGRALDPNRWIKLPTFADFKKMNKSGIMQVIRKNMPDPYAGLSEEEILERKNFLIQDAREKMYEYAKSRKREAKRLKAVQLAIEHKKLRLKRLESLKWAKEHPVLIKRNRYLEEFKTLYNHAEIKDYAKFKIELKNAIEATGKIPTKHIMWSTLYPKLSENLLFEDPISLKLWNNYLQIDWLKKKIIKKRNQAPVYDKIIQLKLKQFIGKNLIPTIFYKDAPIKNHQHIFSNLNRRAFWWNSTWYAPISTSWGQYGLPMPKFYDVNNLRKYTPQVCHDIIGDWYYNFGLIVKNKYPIKYNVSSKPLEPFKGTLYTLYFGFPKDEINVRYINYEHLLQNLHPIWKENAKLYNKVSYALAHKEKMESHNIYQTMKLTAADKKYLWKIEQKEKLARIKGMMIYYPGNTVEDWSYERTENKKTTAWKYFNLPKHAFMHNKWMNIIPNYKDPNYMNKGINMAWFSTYFGNNVLTSDYNSEIFLKKVVEPIEHNSKTIKQLFLKKNIYKIVLNSGNIYSNIYSQRTLAEAQLDFGIEYSNKIKKYTKLLSKQKSYTINQIKIHEYEHINPNYLKFFFKGMHLKSMKKYESLDPNTRHLTYNFFSLKVNNPAYINYSEIPSGRRVYHERWPNSKLKPYTLYTDYENIHHNNAKIKWDILNYSKKNFNVMIMNNEGPFEKFWQRKIFREKDEIKTVAFMKTYLKIFKESKSYWNKAKIFANSTWLLKFQQFYAFNTTPITEEMNNWYITHNLSNKKWDIFYTQIESISENLNLDILHINYYGKAKNSIKNTEILFKKNYIENLRIVYQYEETPIKNYILYKIRKEEFKILHKILYFIINHYNYNILWFIKDFKEVMHEVTNDLARYLATNINIKYIVKYYNTLQIKEFMPYIIIVIFIFFYCVISAAIIILLKSFLPKNLIYGIGIKNENKNQIKWEQLNKVIEYIDAIDSDDIKNLANILKIELNTKNIKNKETYYELLKDIETLNDVNIENIKKLKLQKSIKKISLNKNFFDPETRYIYSWENRYDKTYYEQKNSIKKGIKNFSKIKVYKKFEEKKNKDLKENYLIFYKKLIFEKNLEKWENNTKLRLENPLDWIKSIDNIFFKLIKILKSFRKDKRYNHNRMVFWEDPTLDEWNKVVYVYICPKLLFNFFFIIKFIIGSLKLWNWGYWKRKWNQYIQYGVHVKVNYKELKEHLEKEWSLEWFKSEADYGSGLYFKDMIKIVKQYEDIKKISLNPTIVEKNELRFERLGEILSLIEEESKLIEINQYLLDLEQIKSDRITNKFENKFTDINKKLRLNVTKVDPKIWMEQKVKYKYMDIVYKKKLELEKEEHESVRQTLTTRGKRSRDDKKRTLQILTMANHKKLKVLMENRKSTLDYEKNLRIHNFKNKIVDIGLDAKESRFYDSIPEYKEELQKVYEDLEEIAKADKSDDTISEKKVNTLYGPLDKNYSYYRKWTTMGARMNYILAQILMLFISWFENVKKIRKNEFNIQNIFKIIWIDFTNYIYKMYWEFMIIWNEHKALKNLGKNFTTILKFSLLFTPIIIYSITLYVFFILFFIKYIIFSKTKKIIIKNIKNIKNKLRNTYKVNLKDNTKKIINKIFFYLKFLWNLLNLIFRDIETGHTLLEQLYYKLYNMCGKIQRNIFFIKGAFMLGYNNNKDIKEGLNSVKKYFQLKFNVYKKEKKGFKQILLNKKENIKIKIELILIIIDIKIIIQNISKNILKFIYKYFFYPIFRIDWKTFKLGYNEYLKYSKQYKIKLKENFKLLLLLKNLKTWDLIKLIVKNILKFLSLPFIRIIRYQQIKYLANYKKGIQGFRENPMYLILNKPKKKSDWRLKLHYILMENKISKYLEYLLDLQTHLIEVFFMYKIAEVKWANKNYYQDYFWRKWFWYWKESKKFILTRLITLFKNIEESYQNFEENLETQNWTLWERCKYAYHMYKMYKHVMTRKDQQRISRDIFFYKLAKERDKMIRIYFFKGLINWITYITLDKVIYTKIEDLKSRKIEHKNFKYYIKNIKGTIHISSYIEEVPPQFWALVIIYNQYYKYLLKYVYSDPEYPIKWEPNKHLEYSKNYKWRLASPEHVTDIPFFDSRFIAADINSFSFEDLLISLANQPYDPLIRWLVFILEFGMTEEELIEEKDLWINEFKTKEDVWGDISLAHLLTYNEYLDEYKYEIKEFNRLIGGVDFLKIAENTLERDKQKYYYDQYKAVKTRIVYKNENIIKELLEKRKLKKAKILHKALLRNKLKTPKEKEQELEDENLKEYFYVKKKEFFEDTMTDKFWDWQAEYDSKMPEDTYFNADDISNATFAAHDTEAYLLYNSLVDDYSYLLNNIVLDSFDQTMEEIYAFLMNEVWKILQNILKKDNVKSVINYKHLVIDETTLSRLNYTDHLVPKKEATYDVVTEKKGIQNTYKYKYSKLPWDSTRLNPLYSFIENNIISVYFEVGDIFMYEDKIKFNADAAKYKRTDKYHENSALLSLLSILATRREQKRNIQRNNIRTNSSKNKIKYDKKEDLKFIQNVKWTWDQWLIFNNIDVENKLLNKNTVIFNERFHIWNLKRVPMRLKLPVKLNIDEEYMRNYYKDKSNYMEFFWHRSFLMGGTVAPILKQSLQWESCKRYLEKHFDKNIRDLIIWIFTESALNQETLKIKRDYEFVFKNFIQNYAIFHKLYFVGLAHYSWDLIRYHEIWWGQEEFPYDRYFQLKQIEFLMHDPGVKRLMERVHDIFIDKYKPISYVFFFKYQFFGNYAFHMYKILSIGSFIWLLKVLFYDQGAYVTNHYMFFVPILLVLLFWYLRRNMEDIKDTSKGSEIYLYRYHKTQIISESDWERRRLAIASRKQEWIENFYDKEKIPLVFGEGHSFLSTDRSPGWWKEYSHLDKNSRPFAYRHMKFFAWIMVSFVWCLYWRGYSWKYRNSWWIWEYYRHDEDLALKLKKENRYAPVHFKQREWFEDSWVRLEEGGNPYTRWYENTYRKFKQIEPLQLDMGYHDWQVARNVVSPSWWYESEFIEITGAMAEGYWTYLATLIDYHILKDLGIYRRYSFADIIALSGHQIINRRRLMKQKHFLTKHNRTLSEHYYLNRIVKDDLSNFNDNLAYRNVEALTLLKKDFIADLSRFRAYLIRIQWNQRYPNRVNPYKRWFDFIDWVEYWYNYNVIDRNHMYSHFLIESQAYTSKWMLEDMQRYRGKKTIFEEYLEKITNYKEQLLIREKGIYTDHNLSYKSGKFLDIRTLLSITEKEKHYHNYCYHLIKYKLDRVIIMKKIHPEYFYKKYGFKQEQILVHKATEAQKLEFLSIEPDYLVDTLRRYGRYIDNLNRQVDKTEIIEYKCNLLLNFWTEQKDFWILIKDFFDKTGIIDFIIILVNLLMKIWG